jgi:Zn-dependent M28 family amino/carboxypeptidase
MHDRLLAHLQALEGERHPLLSPERLEAAEAYVAGRWRDWGLEVEREEFEFTWEQGRCANLIARPAPTRDGPRLIIGAHLDTVPDSPGADDNASGVAALLELSRLFAGYQGPAAVEFIAFALEEAGLIGSTHYALKLRREQTTVLGMLSLEMLGFTETRGLQRYPWWLRGRPSQGTYIGLAANTRSRGLLRTVETAMRAVPDLPVEAMALPGRGAIFPEARLSDHAPFWDCGYPALLVTDTAMFRNPHYHRATDTVGTLDLAFLARVTQGLAGAVEALAG